MSESVRHAAFDTAHPVVPAVYLVLTLGMTMFCLQPVLILLSLAGAFLYGARTVGWRRCVGSLRWQLPVVLLIAGLNLLFSASGSTELFRLGGCSVYAESLCFGAAMGGLFIASVLWFQAGSRMLSFDRVMALLGNAMPTMALMVSMCMRLIPRFVRQGRTILAVQRASQPREMTAAERLRGRLRASSVLMGWTMVDSLETADAMRARGWEARVRRSTYTRFRFTARDGLSLVALLVAGTVCCLLGYAATAQFSFYPRMSQLLAWWGYAPIALWMLLPTLLLVRAERRFS